MRDPGRQEEEARSQVALRKHSHISGGLLLTQGGFVSVFSNRFLFPRQREKNKCEQLAAKFPSDLLLNHLRSSSPLSFPRP